MIEAQYRAIFKGRGSGLLPVIRFVPHDTEDFHTTPSPESVKEQPRGMGQPI